ncbi:MAG: glycosyltransferase family 4 protein [Planctomycetes bacterium]|nr:glycosyltransferase family 4 protein [Planctomycetota bacterium]
MHILYHHRTAGDRVERVHIMGMVNAWRRMGHSVHISSPPGCSPEEGERAVAPEDSTGSGTPLGTLQSLLKRLARDAPPALFEAAELAYNAYSLADVLRLVAHRRPDVIYERFTANSAAPTLVARLLGIPIVQEVNLLVGAGRFRPLVLEYLTRRIERWVLAHSALVVTVSSRFKDVLVEMGTPAEKVLVCPNAIDPEDFRKDIIPAIEPKPGTSVVGYVGAFVPYHRLEFLVRAASELDGAEPAVRFLLVGDGVHRPAIETEIRRAGVQDLFLLTGRVSHEEVPRYVASMDVAVIPGTADYTSPIKLFEYMALGKPVLAPRLPGIKDVVTHDQTGLLFEPNDFGDFLQKLRLLLKDGELRRRVGSDARRQVFGRHTWDHNARRVLASLSEGSPVAHAQRKAMEAVW